MANRKEDSPRVPSLFDCNICLATARNAVICVCGHLFCWPCLLWMLTPCPLRGYCPVCRLPLDLTKIIPIYGRNSSVQNARDQMMPRPIAQRLEPSTGTSSTYYGVQEPLGNANFPMGSVLNALHWSNAHALLLFFGILCLNWLASILL